MPTIKDCAKWSDETFDIRIESPVSLKPFSLLVIDVPFFQLMPKKGTFFQNKFTKSNLASLEIGPNEPKIKTVGSDIWEIAWYLN